MTVGTKSVLFGVHCFLIHPWLLALAWWKLYGFPWDPRLWLCFFLHDVGYLGKPNMDGPEGEEHPFTGAAIVSYICDRNKRKWILPSQPRRFVMLGTWGEFCLLHSRYLAKRYGAQPSRLAIADKLVIAIEPSWLYLPRAIATGEIDDYFEQALKCKPEEYRDDIGVYIALSNIRSGGLTRDAWLWHQGVRAYMGIWVARSRGHYDQCGAWQLRTVYAVRRKACGCLVSSAPCRDQSTPVGTRKTHPDNSITVVMSVENAARISKYCREHQKGAAEQQEGLFG